jgi:hypothetical protein
VKTSGIESTWHDSTGVLERETWKREYVIVMRRDVKPLRAKDAINE